MAPNRIALLRAVNVGGRGNVAMAALRSFFEGLAFREVATLLQSGNVVFSAEGDDRAIEATLEREARERLGLDTDFMVRSSGDWRRVIAANPFSGTAADDPSHLVAIALKEAPTAEAVAALRQAIRGRETVDAVGRVLYAVYPDGIGTSKLTLPLIEKKLGTRGTGRNWNTVLKIAAALGEAQI